MDIVKVGIGPEAPMYVLKQGGMPQLIYYQCADAACYRRLYYCDGGITCPSIFHLVWADFVMSGQFAGHEENPGGIIENGNTNYLECHQNMLSWHGQMAYRSSEGELLKLNSKVLSKILCLRRITFNMYIH